MLMLTDNERLILNELAVAATPLSKRDITQRCGMGWATAVKLMTRMEEQGFIVSSGNERQNQAGKSAMVYALSSTKPAAVGIDVEYSRARVNIRNLSRECLFESELSTPQFKSVADLTAFLERLLRQAAQKAAKLGITLEGGGVGVPSHLFGREGVPFAGIAKDLAARVGMPITVDNNIRCFTAAIASLPAAPTSLLVVTIRSGIGVGIVMDGRIYQGERGCSGEIGHFPVERNGVLCRCGKTGCLETVVNRETLAAELAAATDGDKVSQKRVKAAAELLGRAVATMMLVLDIRHVAIYAELGEAGQQLLVPIRETIEKTVNPGFDCDVRYETLDAEAYVAGAARLVLDEFVRR